MIATRGALSASSMSSGRSINPRYGSDSCARRRDVQRSHDCLSSPFDIARHGVRRAATTAHHQIRHFAVERCALGMKFANPLAWIFHLQQRPVAIVTGALPEHLRRHLDQHHEGVLARSALFSRRGRYRRRSHYHPACQVARRGPGFACESPPHPRSRDHRICGPGDDFLVDVRKTSAETPPRSRRRWFTAPIMPTRHRLGFQARANSSRKSMRRGPHAAIGMSRQTAATPVAGINRPKLETAPHAPGARSSDSPRTVPRDGFSDRGITATQLAPGRGVPPVIVRSVGGRVKSKKRAATRLPSKVGDQRVSTARFRAEFQQSRKQRG